MESGKTWKLNIPTKVYYGRNIWKDALKDLKDILSGTVMIVTTGRSLIRLGYLEALHREIGENCRVRSIVLLDEISTNPRLSEIRKGIELGKQKKADAIIGFGGGSAIDAAKAIAVGISTGEDINALFYRGNISEAKVIPLVAMPTTAGTGSELSKAAILTDEERKIKNGIRGSALYPRAAIVDSVFTESVPYNVTMESGFDVLAHAIETYLSRAASPYTRMQSEQAIRIVGEYLPGLSRNLQDAEARGQMSFASMLMGINLGNASTCLPHRLQYPLGVRTDMSHGAGLAALYPAWIELEYSHSPEDVEHVLRILMQRAVRGKKECLAAMCGFLSSLRLPLNLKSLGIEEGQLQKMASEVTGNLFNDPAVQGEGVVWNLYKRAWQGGM